MKVSRDLWVAPVAYRSLHIKILLIHFLFIFVHLWGGGLHNRAPRIAGLRGGSCTTESNVKYLAVNWEPSVCRYLVWLRCGTWLGYKRDAPSARRARPTRKARSYEGSDQQQQQQQHCNRHQSLHEMLQPQTVTPLLVSKTTSSVILQFSGALSRHWSATATTHADVRATHPPAVFCRPTVLLLMLLLLSCHLSLVASFIRTYDPSTRTIISPRSASSTYNPPGCNKLAYSTILLIIEIRFQVWVQQNHRFLNALTIAKFRPCNYTTIFHILRPAPHTMWERACDRLMTLRGLRLAGFDSRWIDVRLHSTSDGPTAHTAVSRL